MIKRLQPAAEFSWIADSLWKLGERPDGGEGHTVHHLLPACFDGYVKILHPMFIDCSVADESRAWSQNDEFVDENLKPIPWSDLCLKYDITYNKALSGEVFRSRFRAGWPRYLVGAEEGNLELGIRLELANLLKGHTASRQWFYWSFVCAFNEWDESKLFSGSPSDLRDYEAQADAYIGPQYWWPADRSWCVCSDYDLDFTVIGGSEEAISAIVGFGGFETFQLVVGDRIDYKAYEALCQ